jgi:lipid-binding SYLF domain-containing protein
MESAINTLSTIRIAAALLVAATVGLIPADPARAATKAQKQAEMRAVAEQTLSRLYRLQPSAKAAVEKSAGYAVFRNFGMQLFVVGGGKGEGVAVNNNTKHETFMKMVENKISVGFGIQRFSLVWLFETPQALDKFVNSGWEFGAQTTAAAQVGSQDSWPPGAISVSPEVWVYQLTVHGLALELRANGMKYFRDDELN